MATIMPAIHRLTQAREHSAAWKQWGPYLSERQWGTVREDYSENGDAWNYFSHDQLGRIFLRDENGPRPVYGGVGKFQNDPHWRDYILFYEYFHGDNGAGLGASHQTGWTGVVARLMPWFGFLDQHQALQEGLRPAVQFYQR